MNLAARLQSSHTWTFDHSASSSLWLCNISFVSQTTFPSSPCFSLLLWNIYQLSCIPLAFFFFIVYIPLTFSTPLRKNFSSISSNSVIQVLLSLVVVGFTAFFKKTMNLFFENPLPFSDYLPRCAVLSYECNMKYDWEIQRCSCWIHISQTEMLGLLHVPWFFHFYIYLYRSYLFSDVFQVVIVKFLDFCSWLSEPERNVNIFSSASSPARRLQSPSAIGKEQHQEDMGNRKFQGAAQFLIQCLKVSKGMLALSWSSRLC